MSHPPFKAQFIGAMLAVMGSGFFLGACATEDNAPPPVFNAIDPSLQCPSGQVGWDFTTGGNESDVIVQAAGSEIKIQEVKYTCLQTNAGIGERDLTASFRAECDNAKTCVRPIVNTNEVSTLGLGSCTRKSLTVKYKCGNEPTVYDISRFAWHDSTSGLSKLVKYPANEATDKVNITCTDAITMKGMSIKLMSTGTPSTIAQSGLACNGKRRCFSNERGYTMAHNQTTEVATYYYTCGTNQAIREHVVDISGGKQQFIDFSCADDVLQTGFERAPVIFYKGTSYIAEYGDVAAATTKDIDARLRSACEGQRSCSIPVPKASLGSWPSGVFKVEYWCGSTKGAPETKYVHTQLLTGTNSWKGDEAISLQCGGRLRIVGAERPWVATECPDGVRVCSLPAGEDDTLLNFFCEGLDSAMQNSTRVWNTRKYSLQYRERWIECPLESERVGIELLGLKYKGGNASEKPDLAALSACNGRQSCLIRPLGNDYSYRFRCPNGAEVESVRTTVNGAPMDYLDCKPWPTVSFVSGICGIAARYSNSETFCGPGASCTVDFAKKNNYWADIIRNCDAGVTVGYTCGNATTLRTTFAKDSFTRTADGGFITEDGGSTISGTVSCAYDGTPRPTAVTKKCIPLTCPNNKKRNLEMDCEADSNIRVYQNFTPKFVFEDPADWSSVTTVKEGFPYIKYLSVDYGTATEGFTKTQAGTIWAYDVFKKKDGTGGEVKGFKCIVSSSGLNFNGNGRAVFGDWQSYDSTILPDQCFKDPPYGDLTSSWYHASRRAGVMNEQVFRNTYNYVRTMVVPAFDSKGRVVLASKTAPNPIGFFYTPATGYIDQYDYLAQQSNFAQERQIVFSPSRQIELKTTSGKLDQKSFFIEKESLWNPPQLDFDFGWNILGDSPYHPYSDRSLLRASGVSPLKNRNPRAVVEIAKEDASLPNKWVSNNMAVLSTVGIGGGNAQEKQERFRAILNRDLVTRIMSVRGSGGKKRPDGWMANNIEVNTVFKARVCIDFDGIERAPGDTNINDKFISATIGSNTYRLGVTTRCTQEFPFTVTRDLFPKPVLPINSTENPIDKATATAQGGGRVTSNNDTATQQVCRRQCTVNSNCGTGTCNATAGQIGYCLETYEGVACKSTFRKNMVLGGSGGFGRSVLGMKNTADTDAPAAAGASGANNTTSSASAVTLMDYNVLDSEEKKEGQTVTGQTKKETKISLGRIWSSVAAIQGAMADLQKKANPKPVKPWWKPGFSRPFGGKSPLPGIAFGISAEGFVFAGIVTLQVEISASIQVGFDIVLKFVSDKQTIATKTDQAIYPCLGTGKCLKLSTMAKSFGEANEDCNFQGGRLAEPRTAAALTEIKTAAANNDIWVGGQSSHIFDDPNCVDLSVVTQAESTARLADCKTNSATQYQWINGNLSFADSYSNGTLFNQSSHATKHGFGTMTTILNEGSPLKSGLLLKTNGALESHALSNKLSPSSSVMSGKALKTARYVCEFDGAAAYKASEFSVGPSLEASAGVGASVCWPSSVVGACLTAEFKFITVGISVAYESKSVKIYDTANTALVPRATIGGKGGIAKWEWAALTGRLAVEIRYFFGSDDYNIVSYSGVAAGEYELWSDIERFRRNNSN